ncbi:MAG: hypothetical protein E6I88_10615 [Chloroflexi bacterium]|nr:MAG: hypothetical protein E6I88_10615 [Chloroflexota bacterium]
MVGRQRVGRHAVENDPRIAQSRSVAPILAVDQARDHESRGVVIQRQNNLNPHAVLGLMANDGDFDLEAGNDSGHGEERMNHHPGLQPANTPAVIRQRPSLTVTIDQTQVKPLCNGCVCRRIARFG